MAREGGRERTGVVNLNKVVGSIGYLTVNTRDSIHLHNNNNVQYELSC